MNRAISRRLLPHSVNFYGVSGKDEYNKPTFETGVSIGNVRMKPRKIMATQDLGEFNLDQWEMYFDARQSTPQDTEFNELDEIEWNGKRYPIRRVESFYTVYGTPHHYKLTIGQ